jgi:hypothetical protein
MNPMIRDHSALYGETDLPRSAQQAHAGLEGEPEAAAVFDRAVTALMRELLSMGDGLADAGRDRRILALDDKTLLAELLIRSLQNDVLAPRALRLRLQGQLALRRLLAASGGTLTTAEVAELLGITQDAVRKRTARGKLLALPRGEHGVYPAFQFDVDAGRVVPGLDAVLALLDTDSAAAKVRFFVTPDADLGETPIAVLLRADHGDRALVERKAQQFGVQLAV